MKKFQLKMKHLCLFLKWIFYFEIIILFSQIDT